VSALAVGAPPIRVSLLSTTHAGSSSLDVDISIRVPDPFAPSCVEPDIQGATPIMANLTASELSACLEEVGMAPEVCVLAKSVEWRGVTIQSGSEVCSIGE
jgi:hypothetical protein